MRGSYHTHVAASGLLPMVAAACGKHLQVLGVSERLSQFRQGRGLVRGPLEGPVLDLGEYVAEVTYTAAPGMRLRLGLEIDVVPGTEPAVAEVVAPHRWDYLMGALHTVEGRPLGRLPARDLSAAWVWWRHYCARQEAAVRTGLFDVLAHPLRLARYLPAPPYLGELVGPVVAAAAEKGVALELNGADVGERPGLAALLLQICREAGAGVTYGAGAHRPAEIARQRAHAGELLRKHGFTAVTGFVEQRPVREALPVADMAEEASPPA